MVRKQLYITEGQDEALKDRARELGISEAELARRALSAFLSEEASAGARRPEALARLLSRTRTLSETHRLPSGYDFNRKELYTDRTGHRKRSND